MMAGLHPEDDRALERLLRPRRVAIFGYSESAGKWGARLVEIALRAEFDGEIVALRPRNPATKVRTIETLEGADVDVLLLAAPAELVVQVVDEANRAGVPAAIVVSSGFADLGTDEGRELERRLASAAEGMLLLGPNCLGIASVPARLHLAVSSYLDRRPTGREAGPLAIVSQSGAIAPWLLSMLEERGIPWSYMVTTGTEAAADCGRLAAAVLRRDDVDVVGVYVESLRDGAALRGAVDTATELGKQLVVLISGLSEDGSRAATSHSGAVASNTLLISALLDAPSVILASDEEHFTEAINGAWRGEIAARPRIGMVTISGGSGAMVADQLTQIGGRLPAFAPSTQDELIRIAPELASAANPIDLGASFPVTPEVLIRLIDEAAASDQIDAVVFWFAHAQQHEETFLRVAQHLRSLPKPGWMVWAGVTPEQLQRVGGTGVIVPTIAALVRSLRVLTGWSAPASLGEFELPSPSPLTLPPSGPVLVEGEASTVLAAAGLPYSPMLQVRPDEVVAATSSWDAPDPWVIKVDTAHAPHRAKLGLIELGVTRSGLVEAVARLDRNRRASVPDAIDVSYVVQPMAASVASFSLGGIVDPVYGPVLIIGPGADAVEHADATRAAVPLPLDDWGMARAIETIDLITGQRPQRSLLVSAIGAVQSALLAPRVREVDVNPMLISADGSVFAVDSLIIREA